MLFLPQLRVRTQLIHQIMVAARTAVARKFLASLAYRVATRRKSLRRQEALGEVSPAIGAGVVRDQQLAAAYRGDDGFDGFGGKHPADGICPRSARFRPIALLTGIGYRKSLSPQAGGDQSRRLPAVLGKRRRDTPAGQRP
jgi:hypothetical protein